MANAVYPLFLDKLWNAEIDIGADTLKAVLVTSAYVYSDTHEFYSSLAGVIGSAVLTSVTSTGGVLDADDTLVTGISAGTIVAVVIVKWTGTAGTSPLFLYLDTGIGFSVDPSGDVNVIWSNDVNSKIFPLGGRAA